MTIFDIGLKRAAAPVFDGIPMSTSTTWIRQRTRLSELGLHVHDQPLLRDVDTIADAQAVARDAPNSKFAAAFAAIAA